MVNTAEGFESVFLTYRDVKEAFPTWPDKAIEDYLSIKRDSLRLADNTDSLQVQIDQNYAEIVAIKERLYYLESLLPVAVYTAANHAAAVNEIITCVNTSPITVTLPATPYDLQRVSVKRTDARVMINGNGKNIDGGASLTLSRKNINVQLVYSADGGFWSIV